MAQADYSTKDSTYFSHQRREILPLLPNNFARVLDVGCGNGATLGWIKSMHPDCETFGIEVEQSNAQSLGKNADHHIISDVEAFDAEIGDFDLILFLDVLEHLRSPEAILAQFTRMLRPGGAVIISVPAVSYIGVSLPLVLQRRFDYRDSGILDRTHTRLFVETTAVKLANDTGLLVDSGLLGGLHGFKSRVLNTCTFGIFRHYLTKQYILRARKADGPQKTVRWRTARY